MDITTKIIEMQIEVITTKNYKPKNVYLGHIELDELIDYAVNKYGFQKRPKSADGLEFLGMKIFEVMTDTHLNVA